MKASTLSVPFERERAIERESLISEILKREYLTEYFFLKKNSAKWRIFATNQNAGLVWYFLNTIWLLVVKKLTFDFRYGFHIPIEEHIIIR